MRLDETERHAEAIEYEIMGCDPDQIYGPRIFTEAYKAFVKSNGKSLWESFPNHLVPTGQTVSPRRPGRTTGTKCRPKENIRNQKENDFVPTLRSRNHFPGNKVCIHFLKAVDIPKKNSLYAPLKIVGQLQRRRISKMAAICIKIHTYLVICPKNLMIEKYQIVWFIK